MSAGETAADKPAGSDDAGPDDEQVGEWLVKARQVVRDMRESDDKRLAAAGDAWGAALSAMLLLAKAESPSDEERDLRGLQMATYARDGAEHLARYLASTSAAMPDDAAMLTRRMAAVLKSASAGDEDGRAEAEALRRDALTLLDSLAEKNA